MGNSQSPPADPRFATAARALSKQELEDLKSLFVSLASRSQNDSNFVPLPLFQAHFWIKGALGSRLFDLITRGRKDGMLSFEDLVIAKAVYEKGTPDEIEEFIYELCDATGDGILDGSGDGPTVLVIRDSNGYIYGGYASQPWERKSDFYGDMKSFLFQLYPKASIYRPTGANNNLQWCAFNFSSDSIPNGIGFGGRPNHFGFFLTANFDNGHTFLCTTFDSPCLSKTNQIAPEVIECWGVQVKGVQDEKQEQVKGSVLERFKEDRNMLKMVGLANSSD